MPLFSNLFVPWGREAGEEGIASGGKGARGESLAFALGLISLVGGFFEPLLPTKDPMARGQQQGRAFSCSATYMHIFVYHYGEYLQEYGGIEKFSNYALESKHSLLKRILRDSTSGFSRGEAEVVRQELSALIRLEKHDETDRQNENENENEKKRKRKRSKSRSENSTPLTAPTRKPPKDRSWSSSSHAMHPENEPYHVSSTKT